MIKRYRKYKLLRNDWFCYRGVKVYRIQATATNTRLGIAKGELGGYVSDKYVIPQDPYDNSWVADNSIVISSSFPIQKFMEIVLLQTLYLVIAICQAAQL